MRTKKFNLSIRKASTELLIINDKVSPQNYPKKYQKITYEIDRKKLKEDVKEGKTEAIRYGKLGNKLIYIIIE